MIRDVRPLLVMQLWACLAGCQSDAGQDVAYSSSRKTLGDWAPQMQPSKPTPPVMPPKPPTVVDPEQLDAGDDSDAGRGQDRDSGAAAGAAGAPPAPAADGGSPRLRFSVLTRVQHPRLKLSDPDFDDDARGPKNMGAIWISKPDGTFVRSLEVWRKHKERSRHLVGYNEACKCPEPDVITSGTLEMHKVHEATWDMMDHKGQRVPEGKYTLFIEVADYDVANEKKKDPDAKNAVLSVEIDTQTAPRELPVAATEHYDELELELFAP